MSKSTSQFRRRLLGFIDETDRLYGWINDDPEKFALRAGEIVQIVGDEAARLGLSDLFEQSRTFAALVEPLDVKAFLSRCLAAAVSDDNLTVAEAATLLNVSADSIYDLCSSGRLRHQRLGSGRGTIRIKRADLDSVAKTKDVKPTLALFEAYRRRQK